VGTSSERDGTWSTFPRIQPLDGGRVLIATCDIAVYESVDAIPGKLQSIAAERIAEARLNAEIFAAGS
jgi:hypothetical protein